MTIQGSKAETLLYLDQITLQDVPTRRYKLKLFVEDEEKVFEKKKDNRVWTPAQRQDVFPTSHIRAEIHIKSGYFFWAKYRQIHEVIDLENLLNDYWHSNKSDFPVQKVIIDAKKPDQRRWSLELRFSANTAADSLRSSLHGLEELLKKHSPTMDVSTDINRGAVFTELTSIAKALFCVARVTLKLLQEQHKYDQTLLDLCDRLQRFLRFADKVADEIVCEETDLLEVIPKTFEVVHRVATFSCDYVKRGTGGAPVHPETIGEMNKELTKVIEDFDHAVNVEVLHRNKETQLKLLSARLKSVEADYRQDLQCMEGTRQSLLKQITDWVTNGPGNDGSNTYWVYGLPGTGKTSLAHSICANLYEQKRLGGAFFCRRDDPNLSEPRNILPTLIYKLAIIIPPFRTIVAERLRNDPNLTPESMGHSLFVDFVRELPHLPKCSLVFVIDALDECGNAQSRLDVLKALNDVVAHAPWLKVIITSRPDVDIERFFNDPPQSSQLRHDLTADEGATTDLRTFALDRFSKVAVIRGIPPPWPEQPVFDGVVSRAAGLFIFIETLALALEHCDDPTELLKSTLRDSAVTGLTSLYRLYSNILKAQRVERSAEFQRTIGVIHTTTPYRPLREEAIAELAGVRLDLVKNWAEKLRSLLCRDQRADGGIRVRHLSISEFFVSDDSRYDLRDVNVQLGIACLKTMVEQLRFNICKLEDSRLANADVKDLSSRANKNITDALQYSSLYWWNHLCSTPGNGDPQVVESLKKFFEGPYPLFWIEVLSIMGIVPIGAPSLRKVISTWGNDVDQALLERIQEICRFITTFDTPISISTPHTYLSTGPFLPSDSPLSLIFSTRFPKAIGMQKGKLLSWPASPSESSGNTGADTSAGNRTSNLPDGRNTAMTPPDQLDRFCDAEAGPVVGKLREGHHISRVWSVAYSPNGQHIISGSWDMSIQIWDAKTGAAIGMPLQGHTSCVLSVAYSPNSQYIVSGSHDMTIRIWDAGTGAAVGKPLNGHTGNVLSVTYSPDGRHIISGSGDDTIRIWDAVTGSLVGEPLKGHTGGVWSVAYSPDGGRIISGSWDDTIRIWDAVTGSSVGEPLKGHTGGVHSVAFSPDGRYIISGSWDSTIRIWDAETGSAIGYPLEGHTSGVLSVAYSPDGRHIVSGSRDNTIRIWDWDAETGSVVGQRLEGHADDVHSVAYSPDGRHIISGSWDTSIRVWDAETGSAVGKAPEGCTHDVQSGNLCAPPHKDGWVRCSEGGLLYWVPPDCRAGLHSPALMTIPLTCQYRSISLDFKDFAFGRSWTHIFNSEQA